MSSDELDDYYDVIIVGTGIITSILSCVASKLGKKVLHLDENDYYGEEYGSYTLRSMADINTGIDKFNTDSNNNDSNNKAVGSSQPKFQLLTKSSSMHQIKGRCIDRCLSDAVNSASTLVTKVGYFSNKIHPACLRYDMESIVDNSSDGSNLASNEVAVNSSKHHPVFFGYLPNRDSTPLRMAVNDRNFALDLTSRLLYGSGPSIDFLISSGVSRYLEFKSVEAIYFWPRTSDSNGNNDALLKVPSSRTDVFNTKLLSALEKRSMMKFHQFVADWGRIKREVEVETLNEREDMAIGRSLFRPQNKVRDTGLQYDVDSYLDKPFQTFLSQSCKLSPQLQRVITYALCFHPEPISETPDNSNSYTTAKALDDLFRNIDSLARYGATAFLHPIYGTSELVQAFCRISAVWGGTFILNRTIQSIGNIRMPLENSSKESNADSSIDPVDQSVLDSKIDTESSSVEDNRSANNKSNSKNSVSEPRIEVHDDSGKTITCKTFICSASYWPLLPLQPIARLSCVSVWFDKLIPSVQQGVSIIPPHACYKDTKSGTIKEVGNAYAVHVIQTDAATHAVPEGGSVLHITTTIPCVEARNSEANSFDWNKVVAGPTADSGRTLIRNVLELLSSSRQGQTQVTSSLLGSDRDSRNQPQEILRTVFLNPVFDIVSAEKLISSQGFNDSGAMNVAVCAETQQTLTFEHAFEEAKRIFTGLFPDEDFSLQSCDSGPSENYYNNSGEDDDDETRYLEATLSYANKNIASKEKEINEQSPGDHTVENNEQLQES